MMVRVRVTRGRAIRAGTGALSDSTKVCRAPAPSSGSLVLLTGEPGIGKSSIAREIGVRATTAGMRVLSGCCWKGGGAAP